MGWLRALGRGPGVGTDRPGRVPRAQAHLAEHPTQAAALVPRLNAQERPTVTPAPTDVAQRRGASPHEDQAQARNAVVSVRGLWKVFGPKADRVPESQELRGLGRRELMER